MPAPRATKFTYREHLDSGIQRAENGIYVRRLWFSKILCILIGNCCVSSVSAVVTLDPNWSEIYTGEKITLRCEIHRGDTEWEYEWRKSGSALSETESEIRITEAHSDHTGDYSCRGRMKQSQDHSTNWSDNVTLTVTSPVHPVTEGQPLILSCRLWTDANLTDVSFYKNGKVIQNGTSGQLSISAVSKSDEGVYKCEINEVLSRRAKVWMSSESWVSVKCEKLTLSCMTSIFVAAHFPKGYKGNILQTTWGQCL
uniref:Ig-like domain-containing protein n=1 Tax=Sphaeramia orbicularis TaxID=375764 RepID=A0A672YFC4_9TELE